jgi:hypothetical protein
MPSPSHPPWLYHSNYTWRRVQVMKPLPSFVLYFCLHVSLISSSLFTSLYFPLAYVPSSTPFPSLSNSRSSSPWSLRSAQLWDLNGVQTTDHTIQRNATIELRNIWLRLSGTRRIECVWFSKVSANIWVAIFRNNDFEGGFRNEL